MRARPPSQTIAEIAILTGGAAVLLYIAEGPAGHAFGNLFERFRIWAIPGFLLYAPVAVALFVERDWHVTGLVWPDKKKAAQDLTVYLLAVLPLFLLGWYLLARYRFKMSFHPGVPDHLVSMALWHLLGVALPEEVFFRGWLQDRLNLLFPKKWNFLGAKIGPGLFIAAAAFAALHFIGRFQAARMIVFFPGMLFGYFRERSDSVAVPVIAHAAGNVTFLVLQLWAGIQ